MFCCTCQRLRAPPWAGPAHRKGGKRASKNRGGVPGAKGKQPNGWVRGLGGKIPDPCLLVPNASRQEAEANYPVCPKTLNPRQSSQEGRVSALRCLLPPGLSAFRATARAVDIRPVRGHHRGAPLAAVAEFQGVLGLGRISRLTCHLAQVLGMETSRCLRALTPLSFSWCV